MIIEALMQKAMNAKIHKEMFILITPVAQNKTGETKMLQKETNVL
jgi:hypothetical protein